MYFTSGHVKAPVNHHAVSVSGVEDEDNLIEKGATLKLVSNQFKFTEGPTADKWGNVFFTDQPNNRIWKYGTDGTLSYLWKMQEGQMV
jgi:gluconolactonase